MQWVELTMGQIKSRQCGKPNQDVSGEIGLIDMLTEDALIKIFSYLNLYDKGRVARSCKRWNTLIKDPQLWHSIDFWVEEPPRSNGPLRRIKCLQTYTNWRRFPANEQQVLKILQTYSNRSLKKLYLQMVTLKIMRYVTQYCPNLQTLSVLSPTQDSYGTQCTTDFANYFKEGNSVLPCKMLTRLQLAFGVVEYANGQVKIEPFRSVSIDRYIFRAIARCSKLEHLTLNMCNDISEQDVNILTFSLTNLKEIRLQLFYPDSEADLQAILRQIADNLRHLQGLRFMPGRWSNQYKDYPRPTYAIDDFLQDFTSPRNITELHFCEASFSPESFATMANSLNTLEELVLRNCNSVTDEVMNLIANKFLSLKVLGLPFSLPYTDDGLRELKHHPSLEVLNVLRTRWQLLSKEAIFETALTLPRLRELRGLRWQEQNARFKSYVDLLRAQQPNIRVSLR